MDEVKAYIIFKEWWVFVCRMDGEANERIDEESDGAERLDV